jgi:PAS domain S-box-containing protein
MQLRPQTLAELRIEVGVPVVMCNSQGIIIHVNGRFEEVFGWTPGEILGTPLVGIIPPSLRDAHQLGFSRFISSGRSTLLGQPLEFVTLDKEGKELQVEHFIIAERQQDDWLIGATLTPRAD